jgi:Ni,Fe-hydrogenase III large subunit
VEALASTESAAPGDAPRAMMLELERVGLHLASLAGLATDIGILQIAATYQRLRTGVINTTMRLSGSRFGRGAIRPFGSGARLGDGRGGLTAERLQRELALIARDADEVGSTFLGAATVRHRFAGTGVVDRAAAMEVGLVGLAARASGSPIDARASAGGVYAVEPIATTTASSGDCLARAQVRIDEVRRSLEWLSRMATREPLLSAARGPIGSIAPSRLAVVMCEGARGEVVHAIETGPDGETLQYKVQDPSLRNWTGLALAVRDNEISDFPICNKSFDLSYCGHDL